MKSQKSPIILIHGFRGNHLGLEEVRKYLTLAGYEIFVPDLPPAIDESKSIEKGKQAAKKHPLKKSFFTKDGYADWIANFIKSNNLHKPILVGHSMGSIIAACVAEKYPELLNDKIVFLSPISVRPPKFLKYLAPLTTILPNVPTGFITTKYLIVDKTHEKDILSLTYRCAKYVSRKRDVARAAKFSMTYAISDLNFEKTALFLAGETDRLNSKEATKTLAKKHNAKCVFLKNSGHLINYECPAAISAEISKFLAQTPEKSPKSKASKSKDSTKPPKSK